jgi:hypothetical protein
MYIANRWILLVALAAAAVVGASAVANVRRRNGRAARDVDHGKQLNSWENEGGNAAPVPVTPLPS